MITIMYENRYRKQYCSDFYFETLPQATEHLLEEGYTQRDRIFYRKDSKAYIQIIKKKGRG